MSNQKAITSFFSRNSGTPSKFSFETVNNGLKKICPYCSGSFYAQGFLQHLRSHPEGAKKYKMPTTGIVKVRGDSHQKAGDPPPSPFIDTSNEEDNDSHFSYEPSDSEDSDDSEVIEEESSFSPDLPTKRKSPGAFGRRLTIVQKVDALNYHRDIVTLQGKNPKDIRWKFPIAMMTNYIRDSYNRPTYSKASTKHLLKNEATIRDSEDQWKTRKSHSLTTPRQGRYHTMETQLRDWLNNARKLNIIIETWMIRIEGKRILCELYPGKFKNNVEDEHFPFKFSTGWMRNFLERHNYTFRKVTNRRNWNAEKGHATDLVRDFHIDTRAFQLQEINDDVYGLTHPTNVYNLDQVPIVLLPSSTTTVEARGAKEVYDGIGKGCDMKRFCTLNLIVPMRTKDDFSNVPQAHIIFAASEFKPGEEWMKAERDLWAPDVIVSFQENAWVDSKGYKYGLRKMLGNVNKALEATNEVGVFFADNLSTHKSEDGISSFSEELTSFAPPRFYPANMTMSVQPIDRHIGVMYKTAVYKSYRKEMTNILRDHIAQASDNDGNQAPVPTMSARDKRILITKAVSKAHKEICATPNVERAFVATGTWLPIPHFIDRDHEVTEESQMVNIQHLDDYNYAQEVTFDKIMRRKDEILKSIVEKDVRKQRMINVGNLQTWASSLTFGKWIAEGHKFLPVLTTRIRREHTLFFSKLHGEVGGDYVVCGSWPAKELADTIHTMARTNDGRWSSLASYEHLNLTANDIDVYYGSFGNGEVKLFLDTCDYRPLEGVSKEVNTIKCINLSASSLLKNNDINITGVAFSVRENNGIEVEVLVDGSFWKVLLQKRSDRRLEPFGNKNNISPRTFVRLAYKSFQNDIAVNWDQCKCEKGQLFRSHVKKLELMSGWSGSPLVNYTVKQIRNRTYLCPKARGVLECTTVSCGRRSNKNCPYVLCKGCCLKKLNRSECKVHK